MCQSIKYENIIMCHWVTPWCLQAESDAKEKDKELSEALERMRQYEAVSSQFLYLFMFLLVQNFVTVPIKSKNFTDSKC